MGTILGVMGFVVFWMLLNMANGKPPISFHWGWYDKDGNLH